MTTEAPLGQALLTASPDEALQFERDRGRAERFADLDDLLALVLTRMPTPSRNVEVDPATATITLPGLGQAQRAAVDGMSLPLQQQRGAWWLPEKAPVAVGTLNVGWHVACNARFAASSVFDDRPTADLHSAPDALAAWALAPLLAPLLAPFVLRTAEAGKHDPAKLASSFETARTTYALLGVAPDVPFWEVFDALTPGGGYASASFDGQVEARAAFVAALASAVTPELARRWRMWHIRALTVAYHKKAKQTGTALARKVVTKALQPVLSVFFGGDWLAYLEYIDARPDPAEELVGSLPESRLLVGSDESRVAEVAGRTGIAADEVAKMLASYHGASTGTDPVAARVKALRRWWEELDAAYAAQRPGMPRFRGLDSWDRFTMVVEPGQAGGHVPGGSREVFSDEVLRLVRDLWGSTVLTKWPDRIVSNPFPNAAAADAFGVPAGLFDDVARTCWHATEDPYGAYSMDNLPDRHREALRELDEAGFPVDPALFRELQAAEKRLGPETFDEADYHDVGHGVTLQMSVGRGRRSGFEMLRDIVTRYRRAWADAHLDGWLRARWTSELEAVAREYNRLLAGRGKPPTVKQFARFAHKAASRWFGGDLTGLYAALGERSPQTPTRVRLLPDDTIALAWYVYLAIGGDPERHPADRAASGRGREEMDDQYRLGRVASEAQLYVQLEEATGRQPTLAEFGAMRFEWPESRGPKEQGWEVYGRAVTEARARVTDELARGVVPSVPAFVDPLRHSARQHPSNPHASQPPRALPDVRRASENDPPPVARKKRWWRR